MSYLVLARKWRPNTFKEVVGQESVVQTLQNALLHKRLAHAYLFCGGRGTGKTTIARIFAKALVCERDITPNPCNVCTQCIAINQGASLDVIEIDGASNTSVEDIRQLKETATYRPASARFKVFIIDEVHMLSTSAFNALLKILEEPPEYIKFIFATTEAHKVLATVLSRCQRYDFFNLQKEQALKHLQTILHQENVHFEEEALELLVDCSQGSMRDALSLLDQALCFSPHILKHEDLLQSLGLVDAKAIEQILMALLQGNCKQALLSIETAYESGRSLKKMTEQLSQRVRDLCFAAFSGEVLSSELKKYNKEDLLRVFGLLLEGLRDLAQNDNVRMWAELLFLKIASRPVLEELTEIVKAIERLEKLQSIYAKAGENRVVIPSPAFAGAKYPTGIQSRDNSLDPRFHGDDKIVANANIPSDSGLHQNDNIPRQNDNLSWSNFVQHILQISPLIGHQLEYCQLSKSSDLDWNLHCANPIYFESIQEAILGPFKLQLKAQEYFQTKITLKIHPSEAKSDKAKSFSIAEEKKKIQEQHLSKFKDSVQSNPLTQYLLRELDGEIVEFIPKDL